MFTIYNCLQILQKSSFKNLEFEKLLIQVAHTTSI